MIRLCHCRLFEDLITEARQYVNLEISVEDLRWFSPPMVPDYSSTARNLDLSFGQIHRHG